MFYLLSTICKKKPRISSTEKQTEYLKHNIWMK